MANQTTPIHSGYSIINSTFTGQGGTSLACWMEYKVISQNIINNTSKIRFYVYIANIANSSGYHVWCNNFDQTNRGSMTVKCDGVTIYTRSKRGYATDLIATASDYTTQYQTLYSNAEGKRFLTVMTDNADTEAAAYGEYTINHNADGTKTATLSWTADCTYTSSLGEITGSASVTLPAIDRAAPTVTLQTSNITSEGVTITALSSAVADRWDYKIGTGAWTSFSTTEGQSAAVTLALSPNTTYSIQVRARRKLNQVYGTSSAVSVTTLGGSVLNNIGDLVLNEGAVNTNYNLTIYDAAYKHTLVVSYSGTTIATITNIKGVQGSNNKTLSLTTVQANTLMGLMTSTATGTLTYTLTTYTSGGTQVGSASVLTGNAVITDSAAPTFAGVSSIIDVNSDVTSVTGSNTVLVQRMSDVKIVCQTATGKNGASIVSYSASINGTTKTSNTVNISYGSVPVSGSVSVTVSATDSRGFSTSVRTTITVKPYTPISLTEWSIGRENNVDSTINLAFEGSKSSLVIGGVEKNTGLTASYRYKKSGTSTWSTSATISGVTATTGGFEYDGQPFTLPVDYSYNVELTVADSLSTSVMVLFVNKGKPLMAFRSGMVGINTNTPTSALDVDGNIRMNGANVMGFIDSSLSHSTDLNDVKDMGIYFNSTIESAMALHYPEDDCTGFLEVMSMAYNYIVTQRYTTLSADTYTRCYVLGDWTAWKKH